MKQVQTIIIGGGIAGLSCARTLWENNDNDFLLITKEIGGRAPKSSNAKPLATFYARNDYYNLQPFLCLGRKATPWKGCLIEKNGTVHKAMAILMRHPIEALRFLRLLYKYDRHYQQFMKKCKNQSQKEALKQDPFLMKLYTQPAWETVAEWNINNIAKVMIRTLVRTTGLIDMDDANGFIMCWIWLIAIRPTRECTVDIEKLIRPFQKNILLDEAIEVIKFDKYWEIKTQSGTSYRSKILVTATPLDTSSQLLSKPINGRIPIKASLQHLRGTPYPEYTTCRYNVLDPSQYDAISIVDCEDGTYLLISNKQKPDPSRYFQSYTLLKHIYWNPAGFTGFEPIETHINKSLYMIGDFNILSMEATYTTGSYTANHILKTKQ